MKNVNINIKLNNRLKMNCLNTGLKIQILVINKYLNINRSINRKVNQEHFLYKVIDKDINENPY